MAHWIWWLFAGALSLAGGILALANPLAATLTATMLAGWTFVLVGILTLLSAFSDQGWGSRILVIVIGGLLLLSGINLIAEPLAGSMTLTVAVAILLMAVGVFRIILGLRVQFSQLRWAMILSGALSILLSIMIFSDFPQSALVVLGVFLAIELISNGVSLIVLAMARKAGDA
ncbi:HdeD family acid-resistance protein [Gemmobacter sp.]|uniref:HdeD family acid-resistance protein n=1 Tax=Gemmobacter sp. TaxID=1898957 RepID=UPI002AFF0842|nr:DUF308 domain-containing protein [Gemmobacter sp.]